MQLPIQRYLADLHQRYAALHDGEVASYIPELTRANPDWFGLSVVTMDGYAYTQGDWTQPFTIQSISKPFVYALALADRGVEAVMAKVGVEPSGDAFNSISLHPRSGAPRNPMINAGAIATTSLVDGDSIDRQWARIAGAMSAFAGRPLAMDEAVYRSESDTGFRNRAIAWMLRNFGITDGDPMLALENYFRQCSLLVDCRDLAFMAATLANGGVHPVSGNRCMPPEHVERVLSVMATCGMYDYAGSWLYEVGMPAKSGVGGGIIAVLPGRFGIGIFSPRLDANGNSVRGIVACKQISSDFGLNVFSRTSSPALAVRRINSATASPMRRRPRHHGQDEARATDDTGRIKTLCLQGEIGVDGAEYVIRKLQHLAPTTDSFILDMFLVKNLSPTAARLLHQARADLHAEGIAVVLSRVRGREGVEEVLARVPDGTRGFLAFEDNNLALQWCLNRLLRHTAETEAAECRVTDAGFFAGIPAEMMNRLIAVMPERKFAAGESILESGQTSDGRIFFIERGCVQVLAPLNGAGYQTIGTLTPGMYFGEMALLGQATRTASVHADCETRCRVLTVDDLNTLARDMPDLKVAVLENLSRDLASSLKEATQLISVLAT